MVSFESRFLLFSFWCRGLFLVCFEIGPKSGGFWFILALTILNFGLKKIFFLTIFRKKISTSNIFVYKNALKSENVGVQSRFCAGKFLVYFGLFGEKSLCIFVTETWQPWFWDKVEDIWKRWHQTPTWKIKSRRYFQSFATNVGIKKQEYRRLIRLFSFLQGFVFLSPNSALFAMHKIWQQKCRTLEL